MTGRSARLCDWHQHSERDLRVDKCLLGHFPRNGTDVAGAGGAKIRRIVVALVGLGF